MTTTRETTRVRWTGHGWTCARCGQARRSAGDAVAHAATCSPWLEANGHLDLSKAPEVGEVRYDGGPCPSCGVECEWSARQGRDPRPECPTCPYVTTTDVPYYEMPATRDEE